MKMRSVYRWTAGVLAGVSLALAIDTACTENKYTPPQKPRSDIQTILETYFRNKNIPDVRFDQGNIYFLPNGKKVEMVVRAPSHSHCRKNCLPGMDENRINGTLWIEGPDDTRTLVDVEVGDYWRLGENWERFRSFVEMTDSNDVDYFINSYFPDEEQKKARETCQQLFSDLAKSLRRNVEIETRLRTDTIRTGKVVKSHKKPAFNYSWMPSWMHTLFSRTVIDDMEKEYDMGSEKIKVEVSISSRPYLKITLNEALGLYSDTLMDVNGDGYFEIVPGYEETRDILDRLAPLVGMEDE